MREPSGDIASDWYADAFGDYYELVYAHRTIETAAPEANFAARALSVCRNDRVLDLCCGTGRHLHHLATVAGYSVGLDYSPALLARAHGTLGTRVQLVRADMRHVPFRNAFDVVASFFTSFGYFLNEQENQRALTEIARALRSRGRFFIDHVNPTHLHATLVPLSEREFRGHVIREHRWIDQQRSRINKTVHVFRDGARVHHSEESVRLYARQELAGELAESGLCVDAVYGDYDGSPYAESTSARMLFVGHRE